MTDLVKRARVDSLLVMIHKSESSLREHLADLAALLQDTPTSAQLTKALFEFWHARWGQVYHEAYVFAGGKDAMGFKRLLKTMPIAEVHARLARYLEDPDPFFAMQRHSLGIFFSQVNRFGSSTPTSAEPRPVGCTHTPVCSSDVEHTRKMMTARRRTN
jgi:hypothetical protein